MLKLYMNLQVQATLLSNIHLHNVPINMIYIVIRKIAIITLFRYQSYLQSNPWLLCKAFLEKSIYFCENNYDKQALVNNE